MATTSATSGTNTSGIVTSDAAISSLGLGSGVLTSSVITQLEAADRTATVTPIENKITENTQKQTSLSQLSTLVSAFQTSAYSLQDGSAYQDRTVTGANSGVGVTASSGVNVQNFSIADTKMATTNVMQSGSFTSASDTVASGSGTLNININGGNYKVDYDPSTTYTQLAQKINDAASSDLTASILQTGTNAYSLVLNSKNTGKAQEISLTDLSGNLNSTMKNDTLQSGAFNDTTSNVASGTGSMTIHAGGQSFAIAYDSSTTLSSLADSINNDASASADVSASVTQDLSGKYHLVLTAKQAAQGQAISISDQTTGGSLDTNLTTAATTDSGTMTDIQSATDASFKYNGIALTRPTNSITDIIPGVTINLLENNSNANIGIAEDNSSVKTALDTLVSSYNSLNKQIGSMTLSDSTAGTTALFSGNYAINSIKTGITSILSSVNSSGQSLANYGVSFNRDGSLSFDSTAFTTQMQKDPDAMASFFSGSTSTNTDGTTSTTPGVFTNLYDNLKSLTSSSGTLKILGNQLTTQNTEYHTQETNALSLLSSKYETMTQSFSQYDTLINSFTSQFASLKQQIATSMNSSSSS